MKMSIVFMCLFCALAQGAEIRLPLSDEGNAKPTPTRQPSISKIVFSKDWAETLHGTLERGEEVRIEFAKSRLPLEDRRYGGRAWYIDAFVKYSKDGNPHSTRLDGPDSEGIMRATLNIPGSATSFIIWFRYYGYNSGASFDSNYGNNYIFPFDQIVFTGDWNEYVKGALHRGGKFQVVYDSIRIPYRDNGYLGLGYAWNIFAHAQFKNDGPVVRQLLQGGNQGGNPIMTTIYDIPEDAEKVEMWFMYSGYINTQKWDSDHGNNYHFALSNE